MFRAMLGLLLVGGIVYYSPERTPLTLDREVLTIGGLAALGMRGAFAEGRGEPQAAATLLQGALRDLVPVPHRTISLGAPPAAKP